MRACGTEYRIPRRLKWQFKHPRSKTPQGNSSPASELNKYPISTSRPGLDGGVHDDTHIHKALRWSHMLAWQTGGKSKRGALLNCAYSKALQQKHFILFCVSLERKRKKTGFLLSVCPQKDRYLHATRFWHPWFGFLSPTDRPTDCMGGAVLLLGPGSFLYIYVLAAQPS